MNNDTNTEEKILEDFILKNPELDNLEKLLGVFNVFETLDIVNAEMRHSNVLAWLLNPESNHGLKEFFLKQFLKYFMSTNKDVTADVSLFDFEIFSYTDVEIRREWNNIDLVIILNESSKKVVVTIENKISTQEHGNQLQRYRKIIEEEFTQHQRLYILLSPEIIEPSDGKWFCMTYSTVADLLSDLLESKKDMINPNVNNFMKQYEIILRRYLVGNSEIEQVCRSIYKKHSKALDLIFQYKPDINLEVSEYITEILKSSPEIIIDNLSKTYIHFTSYLIDKKIKKISEGWTKSNRPLLFDFYNGNRLTLYLYIGPCDESYRAKVLNFFSTKPDLFPLMYKKKAGTKWKAVYLKEFLKKSDFEDASIEDLKPLIDSKWKDFYEKDFIKINEYFEKEWKE